MDAIRKKMKALKDETDGLYAVIKKFEDQTKESNALADQADCDIRDYGKKVHGFEIEFDETTDKLNKCCCCIIFLHNKRLYMHVYEIYF